MAEIGIARELREFELKMEFDATDAAQIEAHPAKTKAERGYELVGDLVGHDEHLAEKASRIKLDPRMTCREAFRAIAQHCLRQIIANEPGMCAGHIEALHQMRIGLRRLRAAIKAFAGVAADSEQERIRAELKWVTNELGPARDLDVLAADVLEPLHETHALDESLADTHRVFTEARTRAYETATGLIRSARFRKLFLDVAEWVEVGRWTVDAALQGARERPVKDHAAEVLARLRKLINKRGRLLPELDTHQRHKLRIRAKDLRYTIEFFASLFPCKKSAKRQDKALSALKQLQDALGTLNDFATRKALIADNTEWSAYASRWIASQEDNAGDLLKVAQAAHATLAKVKSFWK